MSLIYQGKVNVIKGYFFQKSYNMKFIVYTLTQPILILPSIDPPVLVIDQLSDDADWTSEIR